MFAEITTFDAPYQASQSYVTPVQTVKAVTRLGTVPKTLLPGTFLPISSLDWPETASDARTKNLVKLRTKLASFVGLPHGWDGYGGDPATSSSYADAIEFLGRLPASARLPRAMLSADGEISLFWESASAYLEASLPGSGSFHYFAESQNPGEAHQNDDVDVGGALPARFNDFLLKNFG